MRTVLPDPLPAEFEELLERRRRWGADTHDEVWEGVCHVTPAPSMVHALVTAQLTVLLTPLARAAGLATSAEFNLGEGEHDYRVPDLGVHRAPTIGAWHPTAALVVEVVSPGDETFDKIPFYASHGVDEVLIVEPEARTVRWLGLEGGDYREIDRSHLIELGPAELVAQIDWPA
ncbi:MAG TPA: Uma2 family endonuclease [Solirubrobacteraceae bacterium]|nr:Uma2 family endonuclease [Solirubrobacteraceae bacterium]